MWHTAIRMKPRRSPFRAAAACLAGVVLAVPTCGAALSITVHNAGTQGVPVYDHTGNLLLNGRARLGYFLDLDLVVSAASSGRFPEVLPLFIPLGEGAAPGLGTGGGAAVGQVTPGRFNMNVSGITGTSSVPPPGPDASRLAEGTRLFLLIEDATNTSWLLFGDTSWTAWRDDPLNPGQNAATLLLNTQAIQDGQTAGELLFGTYSGPNGLTLGVYIPEPGAAGLAFAAAGVTLARRRRR